MVDPEVYDYASVVAINPTVDTYNAIASATLPTVRYLGRTNPGAITWLLNAANSNRLSAHPGECIKAAKASMAAAGLENRNWKFATTMDSQTMRAILENCPAEQDGPSQEDANRLRAFTFNTMAIAHRAFPEKHATELTQAVKDNIKAADISDPSTTRAHNLRKTMLLLAKAEATPAKYNVYDIMDYAKDMAHREQEVRATTWNGLQKASDQWHRELRQTPIKARWALILRNQQGAYMQWDSAIEKYEQNGYTIRPLTSQHGLYLESLQMEHCVIGYGQECASGDSRIFSIEKGEQKVATLELKVKDNHPVGEEMMNLADQAASHYEKAKASHTSRYRWVSATGDELPEHSPSHNDSHNDREHDPLPF